MRSKVQPIMAAHWWRFNTIGNSVIFFTLIAFSSAEVTEYGKLIGEFPDHSLHDVGGTIYAINSTRIWLRGFSFDGDAPDANFYAGNGDSPNATNGVIIPDENGLTTKLSLYSNEDLILSLPDGTTLENIQWIAIWCRAVRVSFGSVRIPMNFEPPAQKSIGELGFTPRVHRVHADDVIILNTKQIRFVNLDYDGFGPDAYFWTGDGLPDRFDRRIPHPLDSTDDLPGYNGADITITFPDDLTVNDVDFIGLWCVAARQNFGHLPIVSADVRNIPPFVSRKENCLVLWEDNFHISWLVDAGNNKITLTFQGIVDEGEYMAFGISGQDLLTRMVGADVTVVWIDANTNEGKAQDYYLSEYSQCIPEDGRGACPDVLQQNGVEDVILTNAKVRDGVTIITVERPLTTSDPRDRDIPTSGNIAIVWGVGFINPTGHVAKHHRRARGDVIVNFGSSSECPVLTGPTVDPEPLDPWTIEPLYPSEDTPMVAVIGPAGGRRGYQGIVGQVGWGLAWYINGSIIPEIHVERGKTYTFHIYGGNDPSFLGTYHPFYISDSQDGGYDQKTESEKQLETIYATPEEGTLCEYMGDASPEDYENFDDYFQTLTLTCLDNPQPGILRWTVGEDTPDIVYYQCYQHRFFGWKIIVDGLRKDTTSPEPSVTTEENVTSNTNTVVGNSLVSIATIFGALLLKGWM